MSRRMKLSEIIIKDSFAVTTPKSEKIEECRNNWDMFHKQDRWIVVNKDNELIDGYIQYLVLKENDIKEAEIKISNNRKRRWYRRNMKIVAAYRNEKTTYVHGIHPNSNCTDTFMWRVPKSRTWFSENVQVGDSVLCETKFGAAPVVVTKIEVLDKCPVDFPVKKVVGKKIVRNGFVVET